jgi:DNA-binding transcriptional LysR family regulator
MNWDDIKVFLAIANTGGLKKAAKALGMHHSSCARRIHALEQALAVSLFDRLASGYELTQAGQDLLLKAEQIEENFHFIERDLLGKDRRIEGDLCLTLPNGFACHLLMPDIEAFLGLYPGINLKINMTYETQNLASRDADVAIRLVDNPADSLTGKRIGRVNHSAYASTDYLSKHDIVNSPLTCQWLGWGQATKHLNWSQKDKYPLIPVRTNMYSDVLQLAAVQAHTGIASLPCFLADGRQGIERIPGAEVSLGPWLWVLAHKDMQKNIRVRTLIDFLAKAFDKHKTRLAGLE